MHKDGKKKRFITWAIRAANSSAISLLTWNRPFTTLAFVCKNQNHKSIIAEKK